MQFCLKSYPQLQFSHVGYFTRVFKKTVRGLYKRSVHSTAASWS
jgi:hypothetical protein